MSPASGSRGRALGGCGRLSWAARRMDDSLYLAVDLGAGSGRVFLAGVGTGEWHFEEIRRFQYPPTVRAGHLRWDFGTIVTEVSTGLRAAGERARVLGRPVASVGVDSWGVDYGLVDGTGDLVEPPVCYRDHRTDGVMDAVFARVPRADVVERTGIQCLPLNTLYQLYAHAREGIPPQASRLLLIPDLLHRFLTHHPVVEYTNASTTQLVNTRTGEWDLSLAQRLDFRCASSRRSFRRERTSVQSCRRSRGTSGCRPLRSSRPQPMTRPAQWWGRRSVTAGRISRRARGPSSGSSAKTSSSMLTSSATTSPMKEGHSTQSAS